MKWLFVLVLALIIFGGAAWFGYNFVFKQDIEIRKEQRGEVTPEPRVDISLPDFQAAAKLRQEGNLVEARAALTAFIQRYPTGQHVEEAKDLLGEVNIDILLSHTPSPEKQDYIVKPGDVLQKVAHKVKSTPELIMRMNNLNGTMLHIGEHLLISHPEFSIVIQRKLKLLVVSITARSSNGPVLEEKLSPRQPPKVTTKVAEVMAWRDGKRVGFGTKEYVGSTRWIRLSASAYMIYSLSDTAHSTLTQPPPPSGLGLAATEVEELSSLVNNRTAVTITD